MKILLILPKRRDKQRRTGGIKAYIPPLTLPHLAGLTPKNIDVELCDESVDDVNFHTDADLIGITGMTSQINRGYDIADIFRKKGKKVILGGIHVSAMPDEAKKHADSVLIGEAEDLWEKVLEDARTNRLQAEYRAGTYTDFKKLILPRYDLLKLDRYRCSTGTHIPRLPLQATRGCPFNCKFCSVRNFWGPKIRLKPIENVEKELLQIRALGTNRIFFTDDNFIADIRYTRELLALLRKYDFSWICQVSTNIYKHEALVAEMAETGCSAVYMGIESFSKENLENVNKKFNLRPDYYKLFQLLNKYNIRASASMIVGLDGDTRESLQEMVRVLIRLRVSYAQFYVLSFFPGTQLREAFLKENRIVDDNWDHQNGAIVTFKPKSFQVDELQDYYWKLYKDFYSFGSIIRRIFTSANFRGGLGSIFVPLRSNLYFSNRLRRGLHPIEN